MELREQVQIGRSVSEVWSFFMDLSNLSRWDRSVARVEVTSDPGGLGTTFDTIGPNGRRMSYEVTALEENRRYKCVTHSGEFTWAEWEFTLTAGPSSTTVKCVARFAVRRRLLWLAPLLRVVGGRGIRRDLAVLKRVVEQDDA